MITQINPFASFQLRLMDDGGPAGVFMGWIELMNGAVDAGYVYLTTKPVETRLGGESNYVVMSRQPSDLPALLTFLSDGRAKVIRYVGQERDGGAAFLEHDGRPEQNPAEQAFRTDVLGLPAQA